MNKGLTFIVNLVVLVAGVLLIAMSRNIEAVHTIVFITGVLFVIPGVANMLILMREGKKTEENPQGRNTSSRFMGWLCCCGALILGLAMCFFPETFRSLFIYIFALALVFGGLYHLYMIYKGLRPATIPTWVISMPLLMIVGGAILCFAGWMHELKGQSTAILVTGIGFILFAVTTYIEMIYFGRHMRRERRLAKAQTQAADAGRQIEDVTAHDVETGK